MFPFLFIACGAQMNPVTDDIACAILPWRGG